MMMMAVVDAMGAVMEVGAAMMRMMVGGARAARDNDILCSMVVKETGEMMMNSISEKSRYACENISAIYVVS